MCLIHSFLDYINTYRFQSHYSGQPLSVAERLRPTLETAQQHQKTYSTQATVYAVVLNVCITLQILLGAMITALAAVASKHAGATTAVLGACSTLVATYLAKARSGGEPESSRGRSTDLEKARNSDPVCSSHDQRLLTLSPAYQEHPSLHSRFWQRASSTIRGNVRRFILLIPLSRTRLRPRSERRHFDAGTSQTAPKSDP